MLTYASLEDTNIKGNLNFTINEASQGESRQLSFTIMIPFLILLGSTLPPGASAAGPIIELDVWDKLAIIAAAALFLAMSIICMVCILSPLCCLHHFCPFQYEEAPPIIKEPHGIYGSTELYAPPAPIVPVNGKGFFGSHRDHDYASDWSESSGTTIIEMKRNRGGSPSIPNGTLFPSENMTALRSGELTFSIKYNKTGSSLTVGVLHINNLVVNENTSFISPYVRIRLYRMPKSLFSFGTQHVLNNLEMELQTKIQKANKNPVFNELFVMRTDKQNVKNYTIKFQLCDLDKFSRNIVLGETTVFTKKLDTDSSEEMTMTQMLEPPSEEDFGEIHVGLNFLPTSEKLYLTVGKLQGLRYMDNINQSSNTYVKLALMHEGRQLKRTKTSERPSNSILEFDETFTFDVPSIKLKSVYFCIAVLSTTQGEQLEQKVIGRLYLGPYFDEYSNAHWTEMEQNPRTQVACWHKLHY